ncbi:MAG: response regulator [Micavibrio sp.]
MDAILADFVNAAKTGLHHCGDDLARLAQNPHDAKSAGRIIRLMDLIRNAAAFLGLERLETEARATAAAIENMRDNQTIQENENPQDKIVAAPEPPIAALKARYKNIEELIAAIEETPPEQSESRQRTGQKSNGPASPVAMAVAAAAVAADPAPASRAHPQSSTHTSPIAASSAPIAFTPIVSTPPRLYPPPDIAPSGEEAAAKSAVTAAAAAATTMATAVTPTAAAETAATARRPVRKPPRFPMDGAMNGAIDGAMDGVVIPAKPAADAGSYAGSSPNGPPVNLPAILVSTDTGSESGGLERIPLNAYCQDGRIIIELPEDMRIGQSPRTLPQPFPHQDTALTSGAHSDYVANRRSASASNAPASKTSLPRHESIPLAEGTALLFFRTHGNLKAIPVDYIERLEETGENGEILTHGLKIVTLDGEEPLPEGRRYTLIVLCDPPSGPAKRRPQPLAVAASYIVDISLAKIDTNTNEAGHGALLGHALYQGRRIDVLTPFPGETAPGNGFAAKTASALRSYLRRKWPETATAPPQDKAAGNTENPEGTGTSPANGAGKKASPENSPSGDVIILPPPAPLSAPDFKEILAENIAASEGLPALAPPAPDKNAPASALHPHDGLPHQETESVILMPPPQVPHDLPETDWDGAERTAAKDIFPAAKPPPPQQAGAEAATATGVKAGGEPSAGAGAKAKAEAEAAAEAETKAGTAPDTGARAGGETAAAKQTAGNGPAKILLIDDSPFFRNMLTPVLSDAGYEVTALESPLQALKMREKGAQFNIILSDIEMPQMNGFEFARKIRAASSAWRDVPLVALSAAPPRDDKQKAAFTGFTAKFDRDALLKTVRETLAA